MTSIIKKNQFREDIITIDVSCNIMLCEACKEGNLEKVNNC